MSDADLFPADEDVLPSSRKLLDELANLNTIDSHLLRRIVTEMLVADRDYARAKENPAAAVSATRTIAQVLRLTEDDPKSSSTPIVVNLDKDFMKVL